MKRDGVKGVLRAIVDSILAGRIETEAQLETRKREAASFLCLDGLPGNATILGCATMEERERLHLLVRKPTRTLSGVAVIAAMTSPAPCPHGVCVPCPGGVCENTPQSYTGREPAAMRGFQHRWDPYDQVRARLAQLEEIGHCVDKAELIVMGGTFSARPHGYRHWFVKRALQAMNDHPGPASQWMSFSAIARANSNARVRNIGTTFETRPDCCGPREIHSMLSLGGTKVELGVQSVSDEILERMRRGHAVADSIEANRRLRNAGLKVGFHMMPGLPGSSREDDLRCFKELFDSPDLRPDYLKIYPTLVLAGTKLHRLYLKGEYEPLDDQDAAELISRIKEILPPYVRLQRVQRDIPARLIVAGVKKSNLRQLAGDLLKRRGGSCSCIRCREAGLRGVTSGEFAFKERSYMACGAKEEFLSFEDEEGSLVGFLRLRLGDVARIRELHVYGPLVPIGSRRGGWQHRGYGARLILAAEEICVDAGYERLFVTSGIGARGYYEGLGYHLQDPYMEKSLD
ncbi:MAG: tRNA uridine(34) 5-carboxymethylaminomethyl modification radical SAM/GNAT enzyme Elp3 [Methanotrichaceae archaeon]|nr:tRNA uridine(34) 5-carboxymethylaminomethyl modification radical SAM/GNAT enzyme Elp3 [Methanotrichaceae archaeon]